MGKLWRAKAKNEKAQAKVAKAEVKKIGIETKAIKREAGLGVVARASALRSTRPGPAGPVATPAGWHRDPHDRHELRYWDGARWTEHVSSGGVVAVDPA